MSAETPDLTPRQLEVLRLIAEGLTLQEVGERLWLARSTVKTHLSNVMQALGARTRSHAVALAYQRRLLD